ncbi:MAG: PQQ-binding-like beta-propeller repeat protein [Planctomycetes bacterium]|nr:PQQ-binding-like beta-propeller repeat protein [Planctomycetota bacterium]
MSHWLIVLRHLSAGQDGRWLTCKTVSFLGSVSYWEFRTMHLIRIALLSVLMGLTAVSQAAAQASLARESQLPSEQALNRLGLTRKWWSHATINVARDKLAHIVVDESHLFLQSTSGAISAFHSDTGKYLWTRQVASQDMAVFQAVTNDSLLFVVNGMQLFALNKENGDVKWKLRMPGMPASPPTADEQHVYVGFIDGSLYAFDLKRTQQLYSAGKIPQFSDLAMVWRYRTSQPITAPAVTGETVVAFASRNGSLYSVTKDLRRLVFQFETDAALSAPFVRYRNQLLVASEDSNFYSLHMQKGTLGWQFTAGTVIRRAPVLIEHDVYLFPEQGNMFKLSADTGVPAWSIPRVRNFLAATPGRVYVVDNRNNLVVLSNDHGEILGKLSLGGFTQHLANDRSDRIYVATERGLVMCLHERGREFARFHKYPDRQPILPEFAPDEGTTTPAGEPAAEESGEMTGEETPATENPASEDEPEAAAKPEEKPEDEPATEEGAEAEMKEEAAGEAPAAEEPAATEETEDKADAEKGEEEMQAEDADQEKPAAADESEESEEAAPEKTSDEKPAQE